jgi:hypothetical protein
VQWFDANGSAVVGLATDGTTYFDANGNVWQISFSAGALTASPPTAPLASQWGIGGATRWWNSSNCTGTTYYTFGAYARLTVQILPDLTNLGVEYRVRNDNSSSVVLTGTVTSYYTNPISASTTCGTVNSASVALVPVVAEADTTQILPPTVNFRLPLHPVLQ